MEREIECQTEPPDITEDIKITNEMSKVLTAYAKNVILFCHIDDNTEKEETKRSIYEWSKNYFKALLETKDESKRKEIGMANKETFEDIYENNTIKEKIKKEIEKTNFKK